MDTVIKVLFGVLVFVYTWLMQEQNQAWDLVRTQLKNANNMATHDAVQLTHTDDLNEGMLVIDFDDALEQFKGTLRANLGLDENLSPLPGSPLTAPVRIVHFEVLDERTHTFPYLYENETYRIAKYLRGPAVVAVIETAHPKLVRGMDQEPVRVPAIQEYVMKEAAT
ncbi:hypothetical protein [Cohnella thermotolerans]|uniref:hypothetical protein n=1 Tax=Cohnella thermotolerans TaxID=329858 RepID=UPI0004075531|nr:hypothetical protein [Cohnella thermotolerans]